MVQGDLYHLQRRTKHDACISMALSFGIAEKKALLTPHSATDKTETTHNRCDSDASPQSGWNSRQAKESFKVAEVGKLRAGWLGC